jgi:aspartate oxidase
MIRYFFTIRGSGSSVVDQEGDEFPSPEDARSSAVAAVREIVADRIKGGLTVHDEYMDVSTEEEGLAFSISFHDVVTWHLGK